jgi:hypothetical protein
VYGGNLTYGGFTMEVVFSGTGREDEMDLEEDGFDSDVT